MNAIWAFIKLLVCGWIAVLLLLSVGHRLACWVDDRRRLRLRERPE